MTFRWSMVSPILLCSLVAAHCIIISCPHVMAYILSASSLVQLHWPRYLQMDLSSLLSSPNSILFLFFKILLHNAKSSLFRHISIHSSSNPRPLHRNISLFLSLANPLYTLGHFHTLHPLTPTFARLIPLSRLSSTALLFTERFHSSSIQSSPKTPHQRLSCPLPRPPLSVYVNSLNPNLELGESVAVVVPIFYALLRPQSLSSCFITSHFPYMSLFLPTLSSQSADFSFPFLGPASSCNPFVSSLAECGTYVHIHHPRHSAFPLPSPQT